MKRALLLVVVVVMSLGCGPSGCGQKKETTAPKPAATTNNYSSGNPITAPVDYLGAVGQAQKRAVTTIDLTSVNQSIRLFYASEGRFPKDLNELVTEHYLGVIPPAPAGSKLVYDARQGTVKIVPQN